MEDELQAKLQDFDDDVPAPAAHNKLLGAVSELYEKKRVKASTRKEPSLEVSEFHLSKPDKKHSRIKVTDLAKALSKRAILADIGGKLKNAQKRAKTLPKPLEKVHQDQINRKAGFENAKQQLNRWDAIVYQQKVAEQVSFPLKNDDNIKIHESHDLLSLFRKPPEVVVEMAKAIKELNEEVEKKEAATVRQEEEKEYPLTLAEVMEKRKMMAKLRAQQSYQQSKAARQSKIKSKKYHQIKRRARVKEQLREFEELQKKDPEAALKKLEELERTRAEERVSLRHRSTGQWARNLAVRAKYDKDARIALAEQLAKSRELSVKLGKTQDSESEKEAEEDENQAEPEEDPNNPWVLKRSKEMEDFVSGYRKYWETKGKATAEIQSAETAVKIKTSEEPFKKRVEEKSIEKPEVKDADKENKLCLPENVGEKDEKNSPAKLATNLENNDQQRPSLNPESLFCKNSFIVNDYSENNNIKPNKGTITVASPNFNVTSATKTNKIKNGKCQPKKGVKLTKRNSQFKNNVGLWVVSTKKIEINATKMKQKQSLFQVTEIKNNCVNENVTENKSTSNKASDAKSKKKLNNNINKSPILKGTDKECSRIKSKSLDKLFEEVEDKLREKVQNKIDSIKNSLAQKTETDDLENQTEPNVPSLEFKKKLTPLDVDQELIQLPANESRSATQKDDTKVMTNVEQETKQTENINPNKFLKLTQRHLLSKVPDFMSEGDDAIDDEEQVLDRHLTISEAFAEDDVVDQFQKEKVDHVKKGQVENVDLSMPGWGSWAGHDMKNTTRRKRKKFVIKFPKAIPRKDSNRGNVIINEDADQPIKEHQVSEVPFPFTSVEEYEASIRAPLGTTWVPQTAHTKLTMPTVITKMGAVIHPMDESQLVSKDDSPHTKKKRKLNSNNRKATVKGAK